MAFMQRNLSEVVTQALLVAAVVVGAATGPSAVAQNKDTAPPLATWQAEVTDVKGAFPHKMLIVTDLPSKGKGEVKFMDIDVDAFNKLGYFKIVDQKSAAWDIKINRAAETKGDPLPGIIATTGADTVLHAPAKGNWKFLRVNGKKRETAHSAKPPKGKTPEDIVSWMLTSLGWDGVVLAQSGEFLLVGSSAKILAQPQIQALAVTESGDKFSLKKDQRKGAGLLSLSENKEGTGVFDIVFLGQGVKEIPAGTKLIIEKKSK